MNPRKHNTPRERGFTLIEIMVVVVILGLLVSIVGPNVMKSLFKAETDTAHAQVLNIDNAVKLWVATNKRQIPSMAQLMEEDERGEAALQDFKNEDPWGNPYEIRELDNGKWVVFSYGPDKEADTDDDIKSTKKDDS
jgi:general secretion pathway protein G